MPNRVIRIRSSWVAAILGIALTLLAIPVGLANTPYQGGRAVVLTRERQALMGYLRNVSGWVADMGQALDILQDILDETATNPDSGRLLQGGQRGSDTLQRLAALAQQADGARVSAAMSDLHSRAREALAAEIKAAQWILACVGAPRPEMIGDARKQLKETQRQLEVLDGLVQRQRKAISR